MLTNLDLHELLNYTGQSPVLSVFLNTDPAEGNADAYKLRLRSMLKEVELPGDVSSVLRYFDHEYDWSGRSVAVFSSEPEGYFKAFSLAMPLRSRVRVGDRPNVKPLADLLDSYGGYGVALVDKQGARLFYFHLGELREQEGVMGETVHHTKRGGGSQFPGRRGGATGTTGYVDEVIDRNHKDSVEFTTRFFTENNVRRVLIGGTQDNVTLFRSLLPKSWQSLVVGTFSMSMNATANEVLERAMQIGREAEEEREAQLVEVVITNAAKGKGAVVQIDDTLKAVHEGRVQTLLYQDGFRAAGYRCTSCGFVSAVELEFCPYCGGSCEQIPDVVDLAVRKVMQEGGDVEVLHQGVGTGKLDEIGALLRY
jgi:peptide chain release factor subunit 1